MFRNYLKTAFRNLSKNRFYTAINIVGLAIGLATCLLIFLYVSDEVRYDTYNVNADRIYRVNNEIKFNGNYLDLAQTPALMGATLMREMPQIEQYARMSWHGGVLVKKGEENIQEGMVAYADSTLFDVFTLPVISGNAKTALKEYHSLVITETIARKYFNRTDVVGKTMLINDTGNYKVTAVIKDIPKQSHFHFDFFIPMLENRGSNEEAWLSSNYTTYILLKKNADVKQVEAQLNPFMDKHVAPQLQSMINVSLADFKKGGGYIKADLTPLTAIHLHSSKTAELDANGNADYIYIFSGIALMILLIACVNFMNLSTARSANRAKEVGVRKVLGSLKINLVHQFLTESFLISFIALIIAMIIAGLSVPYFNQLAGKNIDAATLFQPGSLSSLVALMLVVGLLAGSYPAFFLSSFQPADVLKGKLARGFKRSWLRNALVVFQFVVSIVLIFGTIVIYSQLTYIHNKDIGFNRNQVLVIDNADALGNGATGFKNELLQITGVKGATMTGYLPVKNYRSSDTYFTSPTLSPSTGINMQSWTVDQDYIPTLNIQMQQGRNFSTRFPTDSTGIIINEAAAAFLGVKDLLNKKVYALPDPQTKTPVNYHIIGVIKNFNFSSLRDVVSPLAFVLGKNNANISVRISSNDIPAVMAQIKNKWQTMAPAKPFAYSFMDEDFNNMYATEQRTGQICITFAVLAILIACLGLFGLVTYAAEQRVREIGVRKVLGASVSNIAGMLSKDFLALIFISAVIALPLAWWSMNHWLQSFAYRITISVWIFVIAGVLASIIALTTISFQAIKAAVANPVKSLRTE